MRNDKNENARKQENFLLSKKETREAFAERIRFELNAQKPRSQWRRGVRRYALDLCENLKESGDGDLSFVDRVFCGLAKPEIKNWAVLIADAAKEYSNGSSLIYARDIAERLCTYSEIKRATRKDAPKPHVVYLKDRPNARESWIDIQSRAIYQAFFAIQDVAKKLCERTQFPFSALYLRELMNRSESQLTKEERADIKRQVREYYRKLTDALR